MDIVVNEEIKAYIDPLTPEEYSALERSILAEGCRDALVLWGNMLVDGHNRHAICRQHDLPFQTVQSTRFRSIEDVHLWMIDQHLGRRSLSDFQRGVLALRKREIVAERLARTAPEAGPEALAAESASAEESAPVPAAGARENTREALARVARLSSSQVMQIERIQKQAAPEVVAAVKAGEISINAAATVASLPREEQVAAATGGKEELKQAAKRVRESRRKSAVAPTPRQDEAATGDEDTIESLRQRVAVLTAENMQLREQLAQFRREAAGE
ncbi:MULTISPECIES: plasmid replication/partition related protein [Ramlibacter]|uniref:Plasmid replication/partition related protein n=1 Tax=Ramlibacter pinisoli TaxID=2682844 RepID=A0A6N8IZZ0_9BURK|nr:MULTISPECIES: plasmid replication/partition related protein [Ramlibacter]MBA2962612.1 plasmid replication/partition related protein [Ramlibacter sp. CGMCC 1.13660]MVQ32554.1 plasmid replication/partition related protein [Ramlibacter pinisoli]